MAGSSSYERGELEVKLGRHLRHLIRWLAVLIIAPAANASTTENMTLSALVEDSSVIFVGTVTGTSYEMDPLDGSPVTEIRLQRMRSIFGDQHIEPFVEEGLRLWFSGGLTADGGFEIRSTMPQLQLGGTYLLFLRGGHWTVNPITGWDRGAFLIMPDGVTGAQVLLTMNGEIVMGMRGDRLVTAPLPDLNGKLGGSRPDPASATIRELDAVERSVMLKALAESIYREELVSRAERFDTDDAERILEDPPPQTLDEGRLRNLHEQLGGEPIHLEAFITLIRRVDEGLGRDRRRPLFYDRPGTRD